MTPVAAPMPGLVPRPPEPGGIGWFELAVEPVLLQPVRVMPMERRSAAQRIRIFMLRGFRRRTLFRLCGFVTGLGGAVIWGSFSGEGSWYEVRMKLLPLFAILLSVAVAAAADKPSDAGFTPIFDGKTLSGWHVSAKSGHSRTSGHKSGGKWEVQDGAITGRRIFPETAA